ncbi:MAG: FtsQ-type POTRA domain-containing protein [Jatrophihabitantaceae bacterium]
MSTTLQPRRAGAEPPQPGGPAHRKLVLAAGGVVLVAAILVWVIAFSSVFGVKTVTVRGNHALTADQIRAAANISDGTPLVRLDAAAAEHRVQALPDVASVTISTSFPSTVLIAITERVPIGYVKHGGSFDLVDRTGDQFHTTSTAPKTLPLFVVPSGSDSRTTGGAVATVAAALPAKIRAEVNSIQALDPTSITLLLNDQRVVVWGSADRSADKARILPALLAGNGTTFDLTDPDQPFAR